MNSSEEILKFYEERDAVWFFDYGGDPTAPHAELTSGKCSDGYINSAPVLCDPGVAGFIALRMVQRMASEAYPDWIVGSAYMAITLSYHMALLMNARHGFVEKDKDNPKKMVWSRFVIPKGAVVLQCEELITTMQTTNEVRRAIQEGNPNQVRFSNYVATAIFRPADLSSDTGGMEIMALVKREVKSWEPAECPLCKNGSKPVRPKSHWAELTGKKQST